MKTMSQKATGTFTELRRSVQWEVITTIVFLLLIVWGAFYTPDTLLKYCSGVFAVIAIGYILYFRKDFQTIYRYSASATKARMGIDDAIVYLETFTKRYRRIYTFLWPLLGIAVFVSQRFVSMSTYRQPKPVWYLLLYIVIASAGGYFIQKAYTERAYGRHLTQLKQYREEGRKEEF
ncbi:MAG: hypothetical protein U0X91_21430 [Spirosomataceae bacterium]